MIVVMDEYKMDFDNVFMVLRGVKFYFYVICFECFVCWVNKCF